MALQELINEYKNRLKQYQQAVAQSASSYTQKDNDLKQHLNNHNAMVGAQTELQTIISQLEEKQAGMNPEVRDNTAISDLKKEEDAKELSSKLPANNAVSPVPVKS